MRVIAVGDDARKDMKSGLDFVANIVRQTLGHKGRNVALDTNKYRNPLLTNDGVSIAREIEPEGEIEKLGAKLIKEAANKTEDNAGDGTTTTMILMQSIVAEGMKAMAEGKDPLELRAEIEEAVAAVSQYIKDEATDAKNVDTLSYAATISCRDPKIGKLVAETVAKAKEDGMIALEDNLGGNTEVEELSGLQLRTGYVAKQFINDRSTRQVIVKNPAVMVTNLSLTTADELNIIADAAGVHGIKVLVVLCQDIGHEFMMWCHLNWQNPQSPMKVLPVRFNTAADLADGMLRDVAAVSGARMIDGFLGGTLADLKSFEDSFGKLKKVVQDKHYTTVLPHMDELVQERIADLKAEYKQSQDYQAENIKERIARLRSACFTIKVGGTTETELKERRTRVQDALNTARSAYEHGVVKGGGLTLALAASSIERAKGIVGKACYEPYHQLAQNAGVENEAWMETVRNDETVLDSAKSLIEALHNASTQAIQFLLCDAAIVDPKVNED